VHGPLTVDLDQGCLNCGTRIDHQVITGNSVSSDKNIAGSDTSVALEFANALGLAKLNLEDGTRPH
jgi:hypothetical protein